MKVRSCLRPSLRAASLVAGLVALVAPAWGGVINEDLKLLPRDGASGHLFGNSIAIDNGVVAVGAIWDDDNGSDSGSAYLFDASTGVQIAKLLPSDGAAGDHFGLSIAIDDGVVAVGASGDDVNGPNSGSAYLLDASTGAQIAKLLPDDGAAGDRFGHSIAINDGVVAMGNGAAICIIFAGVGPGDVEITFPAPVRPPGAVVDTFNVGQAGPVTLTARNQWAILVSDGVATNPGDWLVIRGG